MFWGNLHGRASLPCGCAGGSSASAGDGSVFHRSHMGMASHRCGSTHGHEDAQPETGTPPEKRLNQRFRTPKKAFKAHSGERQCVYKGGYEG